MLMYALIGLSLVLTGVAGLQFMYLFYVDRVYRERCDYLKSLEKKYACLTAQLEAAEHRVAQQNELLGVVDEPWADVIGEL